MDFIVCSVSVILWHNVKWKNEIAKWKNEIFCSDYQEKVREAMGWLAAQEKKLAKLLVETENETYYQKYKVSCILYLTASVKRICFCEYF